MAKLFLFCDEAGTMPVDDRDPPFCVAAVATPLAPPAALKACGHPSELAEVFADLGCVPFVCFVRPTKGYGSLFRRKTSKMNTMARAVRLATGSHAYLPEHGHNARNLIWIRCMNLALVRAVLETPEPDGLRFVYVTLDEKTMAAASRRLFVDRVQSMTHDIPLSDFHPEEVLVEWSDELSSSDYDPGLLLADLLSKRARYAIERCSEGELAQELAIEPKNLFYDATEDLIRPIPQASIERWKRLTGLPEPAE